MTTETTEDLPALEPGERRALGWLMRQCREHPELAAALNATPWLSEAVAVWLEWDDRNAHCFGKFDHMTLAGARKALDELMRLQSLGG